MRVRRARPLDPHKAGTRDEQRIDRELVRRRGLVEFVRRAWHVVESGEYLHNWHIELVCAHLEAVTRGEIGSLLINVPPGCMKSLLVSVFWPVWEWIEYPDTRGLYASFDASLSRRDANKAKELLTSDWFRARWGDRVGPATEVTRADSGTEFYTSARGLRFSTSVRGKGTGWHGHRRVVDDPHKPRDTKGSSESVAQRMADDRTWWGSTMSSRRADPKRFASIIVMQRLHHDDLSAWALSQGSFVHVCLPMEFDPAARCETQWGRDPRTVEGELLWPERYPASVVADLKDPVTGLGAADYAAQYQQRPLPKSGGVIQVAHFGRYREVPDTASQLQSWDMRFIASHTRGDFVVGQAWAYEGSRFYLLKVVRGRWSFGETLEQVRLLSEAYPKATLKLVEDKANGPAIVDVLRAELTGLALVAPDGGKEARANAVSPLIEAGNVYLPDESLGEPWVADFLAECAAFPLGKHDDQVDAMTQALHRMKRHSVSKWLDAMRNVRKQ